MISTTTCKEKAIKLHVTEAGSGQAFLVASPSGGADASLAAADTYAKIAHALKEQRMGIVHERVFGSLSVEPAVMAARDMELRVRGISPNTPVTYIEGNPPWGEGFAGVLIRAIHDNKLWTVTDDDIPCGRGWRRNGAAFVVLQNLQGLAKDADKTNTRSLQASRMIERAENILRRQGIPYHDVVRTWFYLNNMLEWYGAFNEARSAEYGSFGIMPESADGRLLLPASTGIEGVTPQRAACAMDLVAVAGFNGARPLVRQLRNPRQKDAFRYGSAFSRGAVVEEADVRVIEVSGTAAIDEKGISLYPDDVRAQIIATFDRIEALIGQESARLEDICAATVFVKRPEYYAVYKEMAAERGLADFPAVCVVADVCRDELLFEIDAEAALNPV